MARRPTRPEAEDEETPPWLDRAPKPGRAAPPPAQSTHTLISWRALVIGAVIALIAAAALVIGVRRMSTPTQTMTADGQPPLIQAPTTPYKTRVAPDANADPGALAANTDDPIATLAGAPDPETPQRPVAPKDLMAGTDQPTDQTAGAPADLAPIDEPPGVAAPAHADPRPTPRVKPAAPATDATDPVPTPKPKPKPKPIEPAAAIADDSAPAPKAAAVQLGAFSTREKAEAAWDQATAAHPELAHLHRAITAIDRDGRTLYRLRATGAAASKLCATLKPSGAACVPQ